MRVPHEWLIEYLDDKDTVKELAHRLTMGGLEVEGDCALDGCADGQ